MNYAILRLKKRSLGEAGAMAKHALRELPTHNADPQRLRDNTVLGPTTAAGVVEAIRSKLPEKRRRDAVPCIEFFVGGSPEAIQAMSQAQQNAYFKSALAWIGRRFGGDSNVVSAVVHRDETTPHMQVLLVPLLDGKLNAKRLVGNRGQMQQMQDEFASQVGAQHGLRRGERGSQAKHTSIRQFYAALRAAGSADALPARIPVPPAPKPLTMFASAAVRKSHAAETAARERAIEANRERERRIIELARVGLAVQGRARRRLPGRLSQVEQLEAQTAGAMAVARRATELLDRLDQAQRAEVMAQAQADLREQARRERAEQAARRPQERAERPAEGSVRSRTPRPR